tara:strand:+ start:507 stop:1172 length:666 start_codon:yes stop_codon:yes gene_type:complete
MIDPKASAAPIQHNASKDQSMKKITNESASMNVSMTADNADQVAELMKLLKNAGMSDAAPVSSMPSMGAAVPKQDNMADFINMVGGDDMEGSEKPCSVCGDVHEEMACSEDTTESDEVVAEWDNSPDEEYKDANYMLNDLAGGLNRPKKAYTKAQDGDNAMAVESIKDQLWAALTEKKTTEGRGRGKKKVEDTKTTEGRGKVMAGRGRGKDKLMAGRGRGK